MAESSSTSPVVEKPVIVRVKRKASQSCVDAFWLEINERPIKRPLLDFAKLSLSDASSSSRVEESKKKVLVRHLETVTSPGKISDVLRSFEPNSSDGWNFEVQSVGRRRSIKTVNKRDELLIQAKQKQEVLSRNARFEQIWRSRKGKDAAEDESVCDKYRLYDVVRVDVEVQDKKILEKDTDLEDYKLMAQFLPLLQDVLPTAAEEIESDIHDYMAKDSEQASSDGYVYDFYAVNQEACVMDVDSAIQFPLVQVDDDDDYYDGPDDDEYQTDDSNAEDNPMNDYPDEEISEDEETSSSSSEESEEDESKTSGKESEDLESDSDKSTNELKYSGRNEWSDDDNQYDECYDGMYGGYDDTYGDDDDIYDD